MAETSRQPLPRAVVGSAVGAGIILLVLAVVVAAKLGALPASTPAEPAAAGQPATAGQAGGDDTYSKEGFAACPVYQIAGESFPCFGPSSPTPQAADQPLVVAVWAWWCGPCRKELPVLAQYAAAHPEVTVVGMHADQEPAAGAEMLEQLQLAADFPSLADTSGRFAAATGAPNVVPILVVISPDGAVIRHVTGGVTIDSVTGLEQLLADPLEQVQAGG